MWESSFLFHESGQDSIVVRRVKNFALGVGFVELTLPLALEVDGIGQNQVRSFINRIRREQILDVIFRHVANPFVDLQSYSFRIGFEVCLLDLGFVFV